VCDDSYPTYLAKGLGVPAERGDLTAYSGTLLYHLPGIHTWEAIGRAISYLFEESTEGPTLPLDDQPSFGVPSDLVGISKRAVDRASDGMSDELPDGPKEQHRGARQGHDR
jgi:hypothetical protein